MIRHLTRLVWNRKGQNILLVVEILLSFLVLVGVVFLATLTVRNWWAPLGFTVDRVWAIELAYPESGLRNPEETPDGAEARRRAAAVVQEIEAALQALPGVEAVGGVFNAPYDGSHWESVIGNPTQVAANFNVADDRFAEVVGIRILAGRWFSAQDQGAPSPAVVINRRLARELFGTEDVVGRMLPVTFFGRSRLSSARIAGVIEDFRHGGEVMEPGNYVFFRMRPPEMLPTTLTIRLAPGTTAEFEQTIIDTMQPLARDWRFSVQSMAARRDSILRQTLVPLTVMGIVAGFLLLMVALGLTGVVWQNVTRRFQEFGLRRANGATAADIRRQVLAELAILTTLALIGGVALVAQLPVLAIADPDLQTPAPVLIGSIVLSCIVIYLLTLLCAWYPSRLATRIQPAEALHYE